MQQQLGVGNDYRTAGVVDTLTQQVLTETTLLALEGLGERLERATATARDRATTTAVVEQASTDSWSMRFSLFTMIAGRPGRAGA